MISSGWPVRIICEVRPPPKGRAGASSPKRVREEQRHRRAIEKRHVRDGGVEYVAHLIADKLDEPIPVQLAGKGLGDAVDGDQFRGTFTDLALPLIDDLVGVRIVEGDGGVGGQVLEQAQMLFGVGVFLETLQAQNTQHPILRDQRQIDHRHGRLRGAAVFEFPRAVIVGGNVFEYSASTSLIRIGWRWSMHHTANWFLSSV